MIDLQIPIWAVTACGGWLLGIATILFLGWNHGRTKRASLLGQLDKLSIEIVSEEVDEEGESDAEINHSGN